MITTLTAVGGLLAVCLALWAVVKLADRDTEESDAELLAWVEELRDDEDDEFISLADAAAELGMTIPEFFELLKRDALLTADDWPTNYAVETDTIRRLDDEEGPGHELDARDQ